MNSKYEIAVLLSTYNGEKFIEPQIMSILAQKNIENVKIIIRDDGSQDSTVEILDMLQKKYNHIEIIHGENIGLVRSFFSLLEYGLKNGEYSYFAFCDQDDYWLSDKLKIAIQNIQKEKKPLLYSCSSKIVDADLKFSGKTTQKKIKEIVFYNTAIQNICPGHNQVINRELAEIIVQNTKDTNKIYSQDLWITNVAAIVGRVVFDNSEHTLYRMHGKNQLGYGKNKFEWMKARIRRALRAEGQAIALQMQYLAECYNEYMTDSELLEVKNFFENQDTLAKRVKYIKSTKFYRQKYIETIMFKLLYIIGGYSL